MGMQQPSPEILQQLMAQGQQDPNQPEDPNMQDPSQAPQDPTMPPQDGGQPMTGGHPDAAQFEQSQMPTPEIDPMDMLSEVINQYMQYALSIIGDHTLDKPIQSKILLEQSQAINSLVSLIHTDPAHPANQDVSALANQDQQQAEMEMKAQQHEQDLKMKAALHDQNMQIQTEKHQADMTKMQHDMQMAQIQMAHDHEQAKQKVEQQDELHSQKLVHNEKTQQIKEIQAKQAAQSKPTSKQGSNKGKKKKK